MKSAFLEILEDCPIIAAVKDMDGLQKSLRAEGNVIFILFGDLMNIREIVDQVKDSGKIAMVHVDLISGLSSREIAVECIKGSRYCRRNDHG